MNYSNLYQSAKYGTSRNIAHSQVTDAKLNCNKSHRVINIANQIERVENEMMNISFKTNRSDNQRSARSIKRQQR